MVREGLTPSEAVERITPVLVRIQARLDGALRLDQLARMAGLSPFHFHRLFRRVTGETPRAYCERLRLERAAYRLLVFRGSVLDVALDCGFNSHETFTRAFRRRFGVSPREVRERGLPARRRGRAPGRTSPVEERHASWELSPTRVRELAATPVAFVRHVGPYEEVPERAWDTLLAFARARGWRAPTVLIGIAHDAPGITPAERLRFDAAIPVPGPFSATGDIGCQTVPGGWYGVTTHVGPHATLEQAYRTAFERLQRQARYRVVGLPCVELYRSTRVNPRWEVNHTDLCIRVEPRADEGRRP